MSNITKSVIKPIKKSYFINGEPYERLKLEDLDDDGALAFMTAVVQSAVEEYKETIKHDLPVERAELEKFFTSQRYFGRFGGLDGRALMEKTRKIVLEEMEEEKKKPKRQTHRVKKSQRLPKGDE